MTDTQNILEIATLIRNSKHRNKEAHFAEKYKAFRTQCPQLYKLLCTDADFDMGNLRFMLSALPGAATGPQGKHQADATVGSMLFDKYVKPNIKEAERKPSGA